MKDEKLLTTPQVAEILGVTPRRVLALIKDGRLPSQQYGRDHVVKESDLKLVTNRKPGRPPKVVVKNNLGVKVERKTKRRSD